jgi:hypothetical protein
VKSTEQTQTGFSIVSTEVNPDSTSPTLKYISVALILMLGFLQRKLRNLWHRLIAPGDQANPFPEKILK